MQLKLGLISALAATVAATTVPSLDLTSDVARVYKHEYLVPSSEETCFSVQPVAYCADGYVTKDSKLQKVGFHCMMNDLPITREYVHNVENGNIMENLSTKSKDTWAYVETPVTCEKIVNQNQVERKDLLKNRDVRIHLLEGQDEDQFTELYNENKDEDLQNEQVTFSKKKTFWSKEHHGLTTELLRSPLYLHSVLNYSEEEYKKLMKSLKIVVHSTKRSEWNTHFDHVLPTIFTRVAQQMFKNIMVEDSLNEWHKQDLYREYVSIVKRIYAYTVRQVLAIQKMPNYKINRDFTTVLQSVWYKIRWELSGDQVEEIKDWLQEYSVQRLNHRDQIVMDEVLFYQNDYLKNENYVVKILTAGLTMVNHRNIPSYKSEDYIMHHKDEHQKTFKNYYPKIFQRLSNINLHKKNY